MKEKKNAILMSQYDNVFKSAVKCFCLVVCLYVHDVITWDCISYDRLSSRGYY